MTTIFGIDLQQILSAATMGAGIFLGWLMARSHYIEKGWQYCTCPALTCEHCTKDYVGDAEVGAKIVEEALSGCDVHEDAEGLICDGNCSQPCRNPNHGATF